MLAGARLVVVALAAAMAAAACSFGSGDPAKGVAVSVFALKPGQCLNPPAKIQQELTKVTVLSCNRPHTQEVYAVANYPSTSEATFPGTPTLKKYADGACAQRYKRYVGVDYADSALFFTYLLPSARGWAQGADRSVVCFVTTTGAQLRASVKGSKR